jgi:hypothetical protein
MTSYTMRTAIVGHMTRSYGFHRVWFATDGEDIETEGPKARLTVTDFDGTEYLVTVRRIKDGKELGSGDIGLD